MSTMSDASGKRTVGWMLAILVVVMTTACASLPSQQGRTASSALDPSPDTPLGKAITPAALKHPGLSGVIGIPDGRASFATRALLARVAARSIDVQTYIWHDDATGTTLYNEMLRAARRGVRIRLLLDDANTTPEIDSILAMLMAQPNVEVRLYNPFTSRGSKVLGYLGDFGRLNHRMHNKSYTVDNLVTVVGGRNLADEYFEAAGTTSLADLDAMAVGDVVLEVSAEFDLFWNSASAYPATTILADVSAMTADTFARHLRDELDVPSAAAYREAIASTRGVQELLDGTLALEWTTARIINDDPAKTLAPSSQTELQLLPKLTAALGQPARSLDMISPYFVPGDAGVAALSAMATRGVRVRVLTNSLAATDVSPVHAGYMKARVALLQAGVQLYELKPTASTIERHAHQIGSSAKAGLHAKTYAVDDRKIFVGSFNLDPRSSKLNTEMGMLIDSSALAASLSGFLDKAFPDIAYQVTLSPDGALRWSDGSTIYDTEPETSWGRRAIVRFESWLPIDWLL
jgi:cardiolipin synthase C